MSLANHLSYSTFDNRRQDGWYTFIKRNAEFPTYFRSQSMTFIRSSILHFDETNIFVVIRYRLFCVLLVTTVPSRMQIFSIVTRNSVSPLAGTLNDTRWECHAWFHMWKHIQAWASRSILCKIVAFFKRRLISRIIPAKLHFSGPTKTILTHQSLMTDWFWGNERNDQERSDRCYSKRLSAEFISLLDRMR